MLRKIFIAMLKPALNRRQVIRLSRVLMNEILGDNNCDIRSNGEFSLLHQILSSRQRNRDFVVFDVGANIGRWTISLLNIAREQGIVDRMIVHSFEPSRITFLGLQENLAKLPTAQRVYAVNVGMSNTPGTQTLYVTKDGAGTNSFYRRRTEGFGIIYDKTEAVQTTTLDIYCRGKGISYIDFLKVDVEGHELVVMQGAVDMLRQQAINYIQFEYGGCWIDSRSFLLDMYDLLTSFGYSVGKILPKMIEFYNRYDQRIESFQMANFLACLPDSVNQFKQIKPWWVS